MNTRRNAYRRVHEAAAGGTKVPPQDLVNVDKVPVNPAGLTDGEVRNTLLQMA